MWARQLQLPPMCRETDSNKVRDKYIKKTLTCPVAVVCQSRKVQSRDIVARLCATKSLLDLHGRRLAEKRVKDKHQLHQSGGSTLLKLSNTLPAPALVYLQAGRRQGGGAAGQTPACWLALCRPLRVGVANFMFFSIPLPPPFSLRSCVPVAKREREGTCRARRARRQKCLPILFT